MKVQIRFHSKTLSVDESFSAPTADLVVTAMRDRAAGRAALMLRMVIRALPPLTFAGNVVERYNEATGRSVPAPASCEAFLKAMAAEGVATIED